MARWPPPSPPDAEQLEAQLRAAIKASAIRHALEVFTRAGGTLPPGTDPASAEHLSAAGAALWEQVHRAADPQRAALAAALERLADAVLYDCPAFEQYLSISGAISRRGLGEVIRTMVVR